MSRHLEPRTGVARCCHGIVDGVTSTAVPGVTGMGMFDATRTLLPRLTVGCWISPTASVEGPLSIVICSLPPGPGGF